VSQRLVSVAITILIPVLAFGQQYQKLRDRDPDLSASKQIAAELQQANFHYGPWYLMSRLRVSDAGFTEAGGYLPTGGDDGGISLSVEAPQRLYFVPRKKTVYTFEVVPGYTFFGSERSNQFNYTARADAHFLLNHLYLDVYATGVDQLRAHVSDINRLATLREQSFGVAGEWKYSSRTSTMFNVNYRDVEYPLDRYQPNQQNGIPIPVDLLDRTERNARVSFVHKTFPLTSLFVAAERSTYQFQIASFKDAARTYYGGGLRWNSGRTTFNAEAGPVKLDHEDPLQRDFEGVSGRFSLSRTNGPWGLLLAGDRDIGFAITRNNNYFTSNTVSAGLTRQIGRRLTVRANATRQRDQYDEPIVVSGNPVDREDDISFYSVGAMYGIRRVRFGGDVGWYERTSTIFTEEESGIRYAVHLSITP
jgi:hypothetical protein